MTRRRVAQKLALLGAVTVFGTACGGLLFAKDTRVTIVVPHDLATVSTPVHLRWTSRLSSKNALIYAVFVDALPVHPGQNLRALAGARCAGVPTCVDLAWLNRHEVYLTREPSLDLDALPILGTPKGDRDLHKVTIVIVNSSWQRLGESAWTVTFGLSKAP